MKQCSRKKVLSIKASPSLNHLNTRGIDEGESPSCIRQITKSDDSLDRSQYKDCQPSLQREVGEKSETRLRVTTKVETSQRLKVESGD